MTFVMPLNYLFFTPEGLQLQAPDFSCLAL